MPGGDYVLRARRRAGLTQRELASRLGLRQATIARWERGDRQVSVEDVEAVAAACGLLLEAHHVAEDRSWWSQIALQLELGPLDRVRRRTQPGSPDLAAFLSALTTSDQVFVVIGEVAAALQGRPPLLGGAVIVVCTDNPPLLADAAQRLGRNEYGLPGGARLGTVNAPLGTLVGHNSPQRFRRAAIRQSRLPAGWQPTATQER